MQSCPVASDESYTSYTKYRVEHDFKKALSSALCLQTHSDLLNPLSPLPSLHPLRHWGMRAPLFFFSEDFLSFAL